MSQQFNSLSHKSSWLNTLFIFNSDFQSALTIILCLIFAAFNVSLPQLTSFSALSSIALLNIILLVFTYILLAKSDSNAPYLGLTFAMSFGSVMLFNLSQNMAFIGISVSILISPLTLWITQSYIHCLVSLFTQLINVILLFKLHFEEALKYMPTETLSEKITLSLTLTCFGTMLMFGYFFHSQVKPIPIANLPSDSHNIDYPPNSLFDRQKLLISFILEVKALTETALGSLSLVSSHIESGLGEKLVNIALASTENLQRTFDNIIEVDVKNLENHKIESKATNVKDLFNNAWKSMLLFIHKKELQGTLEVNDNLPEVIAIDSDKVSQLTRNLLDYFVRITSKGAVNVKVEMAEKRFETHAPEIAEFIIESTTNCVDQSFMSANCIKTPAKIQIFKPDARAERSLKVTIRNGVSENFEDDHGLIKGSVNEFLLASSQDELSKLNLYMSQRICESLGGKMAIYAKSESENAVVAYIPFKVFS